MDDEIEIELRPPAEVARRVIVLATLLRRIALEDAASVDAREAEGEAFDLREWLQGEGLRSAATEREAVILAAPVGRLQSATCIEISWQGEAMAALLWVLGRAPAPLPDGRAAGLEMAELPAPWDSTEEWISTVQMRSEEAIAIERERAEIWHWRSIVEALRRAADPAERQELEQAIVEVVTDAVAAGLLEDVVADDFAVEGSAVREVPDSTLESLASAWEQRLWALNWACGFGLSWDDVPLDV